ncbi:hypothetical protein CYLTODRAFT_460748 [Cylindrobasidium torrendii FP15055 ss-10]|uniref:Zn(2)-C6 fungal-type domain-containing protein n=1 Tax=Cylindrobasidium torrendii FP15055 ss-10 TaxID=1314674 RepID=A0A0D7AQ88_9AGAR|nr:hypothetical protein CYLTODRAFT_460748 [Cylindrobasidium torrendii FP15055 ss-10]
MGPPTTPSTTSKRMRSPSVESIPAPKKNRRTESRTKDPAQSDRAKKGALERLKRNRERKQDEDRRRKEVEQAARVGDEQDPPCERCAARGYECYRKPGLKCSRCRIDRRGCSFRPKTDSGPKVSEEVELDSALQCQNDIRDAVRVGVFMLGVYTQAYDDDEFFRDWIQDFRQLFVRWSARDDPRWQQYHGLGVPGPSGTSHRNSRDSEMDVDDDKSQSDEEEEEAVKDRGRSRRKD